MFWRIYIHILFCLSKILTTVDIISFTLFVAFIDFSASSDNTTCVHTRVIDFELQTVRVSFTIRFPKRN